MTGKRPKYGLTYLDTRNPGTIVLDVLTVTPERRAIATRVEFNIREAADLSQRLAEAVRSSGYDMVPKLREGR